MKIVRIPILGILLMMLYAWPLTVRPELAVADSHERQATRYTVRQGGSLSKIARRFYQDASLWRVIFDANKALIKTPGALEVGWSLLIPNLDDPRTPANPQPLQQAVKESAPVAAPPPARQPPATAQPPVAPTAEPVAKRTIVTRNLYPPFVLQTLQNQGMLTEMIRAAFKAMNYEVDIHFRALDEGLSAAREGRVTGVFPHVNDPSYNANFFASQPLYRVLVRAFVRTASPIAFDTLDDLKGLVLCQPEGVPTAELQPLIASGLIKIERPSSIEACFKALIDNRVDMVVANEFGGRNALYNLGVGQQICVLDKAVAIETMHLLFSKVAPQSRIVQYEFDQALRDLEKSGQLKAITTRHLQSYYQTQPITLQTCPAATETLTSSASSPPATAPLPTADVNPTTQVAALPPAQPQRDIDETQTPKPMKPAVESSFSPVRPVMPQQSTDDLARIAPLTPPHKQVGEFLDYVAPVRPPKQLELVSLAVTNQPKIDGYAEETIWELAPAVTTLVQPGESKLPFHNG